MRLIDNDLISRSKLIDHLNACFAESDGDTPITDAVIVAIRCAVEQMPDANATGITWHKVTTRPLTDEETAYYAEMEIDGIEYIFDCEMPDDGQEILIATKWGTDKDICSNDADYGIGLEGRGDWDGVYAWAEMPKYKEDDDETD